MIITKSPTINNSGHVLGQFFKSKCNNYAYIPIPKCASTWTTKYLSDGLGWKVSRDIDNICDLKVRKIVVLREPMSRWISGMAQYLTMHHPRTLLHSRELVEFIFKRIDFDDHTMPQVNYLHGLDSDEIVFFKFDNDLENNVKYYIKDCTDEKYDEPVFRNDTPADGFKAYANQKLKILLESNEQWKNNVLQYYKDDINLYGSVVFYGK